MFFFDDRVLEWLCIHNRLNNLRLRIARVFIVYSVTCKSNSTNAISFSRPSFVYHPCVPFISAYLAFSYIKTQQKKLFLWDGGGWAEGVKANPPSPPTCANSAHNYMILHKTQIKIFLWGRLESNPLSPPKYLLFLQLHRYGRRDLAKSDEVEKL